MPENERITVEVKQGVCVCSLPLLKLDSAPISHSGKSKLVGGTGGFLKVEGVPGYPGLKLSATLIVPLPRV